MEINGRRHFDKDKLINPSKDHQPDTSNYDTQKLNNFFSTDEIIQEDQTAVL